MIFWIKLIRVYDITSSIFLTTNLYFSSKSSKEILFNNDIGNVFSLIIKSSEYFFLDRSD